MEIRLSNGTVQVSKVQNLTSSEVERQIKNYNYESIYGSVREASGGKNTKAESIQFPPVNIVFYLHVFLYGKVPDPLELLVGYYRYYESKILIDGCHIKYGGMTISKIDVDARLLRTYPSLVRDLHFYLLLVESSLFDEVSYSTAVDLQGKDLIVKANGKTAIVSLMVDTKRSKKYKQDKNRYRHSYELPELVLAMDLSSAATCGDFKMYGEADVERVEYFLTTI